MFLVNQPPYIYELIFPNTSLNYLYTASLQPVEMAHGSFVSIEYAVHSIYIPSPALPGSANNAIFP